MSLVRKLAIFNCILILVGFAFTGLWFSPGSIPAAEGSREESQTFTEHEKKIFFSMDGNKEERELPGKDARSGGIRMLRGTFLLLLMIFTLRPCTLMEGCSGGYLRRLRARAFHMERFRRELMSQKEKDGKKRMLIPA